MQEQDEEQQISSMEIKSRNSGNEFLMDVANAISIFGLIFGCFITYQLLVPRLWLNTTAHAVDHQITAPIQTAAMSNLDN